MTADPLHSRTRPIEADLTAAMNAAPHQRGYGWIRDGVGLVGWGAAARIDPGCGAGRFKAAGAVVDRLDTARHDGPSEVPPTALAAFTFDADAAGSAVIVPEVLVRATSHGTFMTVAVTDPDALDARWDRACDALRRADRRPPSDDRIRYAGASRSELEWLEAVAAAIEKLEHSVVDKVVLARDVHVWARADFDVWELAGRLAVTFPSCFTYVFDGLVGASPEMLVRRRGATVESVVLAGSARRGKGATDDARRGAALAESSKDLAEHDLAVASVAGPLGAVCSSVELEGPSVMKLANVQHLATAVRGSLARDLTVLELAGMLHPTAAVGGTPRDTALDVIATLEKLDRARYSGVVGAVEAGGNGELAIALRCGEFEGARGRLFAGAGLVPGSVPEAELEETRLKLRAMEAVLEGSPA